MSMQQALLMHPPLPPHTCSASPNPAYGYAPSGFGVPAQISSTITTSGGIGPFTHNGTFISGGVGINILTPTTATPGWETQTTADQFRTGTYRHTVTDTATTLTAFVDIVVELEIS
jgi:hypothetical protein